MEITDQVLAHLPWKRKSSPSGWISFNAPCCVHLGHNADTRGRGGVHLSPEGGINFHCFNCHLTTGWQPGRRLSYKMRRFMAWLGMAEELIGRGDSLMIQPAVPLRRLHGTFVTEEELKRTVKYCIDGKDHSSSYIDFSGINPDTEEK